MKAELQAELFRRYPKCFRKPGTRLYVHDTGEERLIDAAGPIDERGIESGDGWFAIVDRLSAACEKEIERLESQGVPRERWPAVVQIKEKLGTMRFYVRGPLSEGLRDQILREHGDGGESASTCEDCGAPKNSRPSSRLNTCCADCEAAFAARKIVPFDAAMDEYQRQRAMLQAVLAAKLE